MRTIHLLEHFVGYNLWANERAVGRLLKESEDVLDRPAASSFPTLRETVLHIRNAEHTWWGRISGSSTRWPVDEQRAISALIPCSEQLCELVRGPSEIDPLATATYNDLRGNPHTQPIWQMLLHCVNHSTQHRGQLITQMRSLGLSEIPANDMVVYQRLHG